MARQDRHTRFTVGLTGGIGSGKSAVSALFAALGVTVIDADQVARALVTPGSPALRSIVGHFGMPILRQDGELDRARLRQLIFADPDARAWLEHLLHPLIRERIEALIAAATSDYVLLVVPLLLESGAYDFVNRVLVVDVPEALQVARVAARDRIDPAAAKKIMATQMPRQERLARADDVIDNSGLESDLNAEVKRLHEFYRQQSTRQHQTGQLPHLPEDRALE
ncbi:MAG: dephospho-CoA kinase [Pseudomonadales bacterium]|nr:dephospho-CoA kinase [Pseudomonadales bacterium]